MKKKYLILFISLIIIFLSGCNLISNKTVSLQKGKVKESNQSFKKYFIGKGSLKSPETIKWELEFGRKAGLFRNTFGNYKGYLIGLGTRPTGGYSINISLNKEADTIKICYEEMKPPKGSFNTQVITNNYNVIYVKKGDYKVQVFQIINGKKILRLQD